MISTAVYVYANVKLPPPPLEPLVTPAYLHQYTTSFSFRKRRNRLMLPYPFFRLLGYFNRHLLLADFTPCMPPAHKREADFVDHSIE